jgi:carbon-monoxide dehydrogenase medium subunit
VQDRDRGTWFRAPRDLTEAIDALSGGGRVLAGGTDLVASMNLRGECPGRVVWIGRLGLERIVGADDLLRVGAGAPLATVASDPSVRAGAAALAAAAGKLAGPSVRNLATLGGSLCAAWPRSDIGCAVLALDAVLLAVGPGGERRIKMADLYAGPRRTTIAPDEILIEVQIRPTARSAFTKIGRRSSFTLPVVNAATRLELDEDGAVSEATVAVGAGSVPERAPSVEAALLGRSIDVIVARAAAGRVLDDVTPTGDEHATSWYRAQVAPVAVARALLAAGVREGTE